MRLDLAPGLTLDLTAPDPRSDGLRIWIGGESGSGKTCAAIGIAAQMIEQGGQVVVLDAHGEYAPLATVGPVRLVGYGGVDGAGASHGEAAIAGLLSAVADGQSCAIDLKEWVDTQPALLDAFTASFMRGLYALQKRRRVPLLLVVEEAQVFAPQIRARGEAEQVRLFVGVATGGRKFGINLLVATQRPSLVDKSVLASCNVKIFLRHSDFKDWKTIADYIPDSLGVGYEAIRRFASGEAIVLCRWLPDARVLLHPPLVAPRV